jgi:hypothetical protein
LYVKDVVNKDSTIQSDVRRFCLQVRRIQVPCQPSGRSSHPVRTPIYPLFYPSGRRVIPSRCQIDQHHPSGRRAIPSGPYTVLRSFCASLHTSRRLISPSGRPSVIDQLQILSKFRIREDRYIRPEARLHKARIAIQISQSERQSALVRTRVQLIWKLPI